MGTEIRLDIGGITLTYKHIDIARDVQVEIIFLEFS